MPSSAVTNGTPSIKAVAPMMTISEIATPSPLRRASSIAALAFFEILAGSRARQTTTWVSTRITEECPILLETALAHGLLLAAQ